MINDVLKLIRIFQSFTIDELLPVLECSKNELLPIIEQLEAKKIIVHSNNKYFYLKNAKSSPQSVNTVKKCNTQNKIYNPEYLITINKYYETEPEKLFYKERDIDFFKQAYSQLKERIIAYLKIIDKIYNMDLETTENFLRKLKEQYPALRFKNITTIKLRDNFKKIGLRAFETAKVHQKNFIPEKMYLDFKKIFLYSNKYSFLGAYNELGNIGYNMKLIPCYKTFQDRIKEEFTQAEINNMRNNININPLVSTLSFDILKTYVNSTSTKTFKKSVEEFLNNFPDENCAIFRRRARHIKIHLLPYFEQFAWNEITASELQKFIKHKIEDCHYKYETIREIVFTLYKIKREYVDDTPKELQAKNSLTKEDIMKIHNDIPKLWIIATGFTETELLGLRYEDVNYEKKTIISKNLFKNGELLKINKPSLWKEIRLPNKLLNKLDKNKKGLIFKNIHFDNQEILRNTFFFLCIEKNVPFNIIARQLGFNNLQVFYKEHKKYIPKECDIDLLEDII